MIYTKKNCNFNDKKKKNMKKEMISVSALTRYLGHDKVWSCYFFNIKKVQMIINQLNLINKYEKVMLKKQIWIILY